MIRGAAQQDLPELLPLLRAYCEFYEVSPTEEGLREMAASVIALPDDQAFVLVATDRDERIVGLAVCCWKWSSLRGARIVFLDDLFVDPAARGEGHADALIEAVADIARRGGGAAVEWLTATDNHRAQTVYDRVGGKAETLIEYELEVQL